MTSEHRGLPFVLSCRRSLARVLDTEAAEILAMTTACFDRYAEIFDEPFPFGALRAGVRARAQLGRASSSPALTFRDEMLFRSRRHEPSGRSAPWSSPTRWRTCGSATSSRCGGGTTSGSASRSPSTWAIRPSSKPTRFTGTWTGVRHRPARPGATTPTSAPPPTRSPRTPGTHRHRDRARQLRRHLLRQGRLRPAPARRLARRGGVPRRHQRPPRGATGSATPP